MNHEDQHSPTGSNSHDPQLSTTQVSTDDNNSTTGTIDDLEFDLASDHSNHQSTDDEGSVDLNDGALTGV